jgi:hypothetical protein
MEWSERHVSRVGDVTIRWEWRDPEHLEAHRKEFTLPVERVLDEVAARAVAGNPGDHPLDPRDRAGAESEGTDRWVHIDMDLGRVTGLAGLRDVPPDGSQSFWGYRLRRAIPSHLCFGQRRPTSHVCVWGIKRGERFIIHTIYPGTVAPREIHDPELALTDLPASIEFWRSRAIIVAPEEYRLEPDQ